jgi:hypothetical protein
MNANLLLIYLWDPRLVQDRVEVYSQQKILPKYQQEFSDMKDTLVQDFGKSVILGLTATWV